MSDTAALKPILEELLVWTRVGFYSSAKEMLAAVLNTEKKRRAYQAADGNNTIDAIRQEVKMSPNDITDLFRRCVALGLMKVENNRRIRLFDLSLFEMGEQGEDGQ